MVQERAGGASAGVGLQDPIRKLILFIRNRSEVVVLDSECEGPQGALKLRDAPYCQSGRNRDDAIR